MKKFKKQNRVKLNSLSQLRTIKKEIIKEKDKLNMIVNGEVINTADFNSRTKRTFIMNVREENMRGFNNRTIIDHKNTVVSILTFSQRVEIFENALDSFLANYDSVDETLAMECIISSYDRVNPYMEEFKEIIRKRKLKLQFNPELEYPLPNSIKNLLKRVR